MSILTFQTELRPALPNVYGASDYREFRDQLSQMDHLLGKSGMGVRSQGRRSVRTGVA